MSKHRVVLLNYADDRFGHKGALFKRCQNVQSESALKHGVDEVVSWSWDRLAATARRSWQCYRENESARWAVA